MNKKDQKKYYRSTFTFNGKRYERKSPISQREADRKADALKVQLESGTAGVSSNMSVEKWANEWLETYKRPAIGESQYIMYKGYINNAIIPAIGSMRLKDVKDIDLQKIINARAGNSKSDIDKIRYTIKGMFRRAHISELIIKNPAEYLTSPKAESGTHRSITDYEREKILEVAELHPAGLWVKLTLYCGIRPGEARALDWRHVDFENNMLHIQSSMKSKTREIGTPKSTAGVRDIPIPDVLLPELKAAAREPFSPVVIKPISKKRHDEGSMSHMWLNFKRALDISMGAKLYRNKIIISAVANDLVPYCLRHTYCTDLENKGVLINIAKYLMGHSSIEITARIYTHTSKRAIEDAAKLININA